MNAAVLLRTKNSCNSLNSLVYAAPDLSLESHGSRAVQCAYNSCGESWSHMLGSTAQVDPFAEPGGEALDALWHQEYVVAHEAAQGHCINCAIQFRQRVEHNTLQPCYAVPGPRGEVLHELERFFY